MDRLVEESRYVFRSTIVELNASNEPAVRSGPGLVVAHVDEAFRAAPSVGVAGLRDRDVTILTAGEAPAVGDTLIVFANDWVYGTEIALREVAHRRATARAVREVVAAVERLPVSRLEARLDGAVLVVDGEVERVEPSPIPDGFALTSPYYRLAVVRVESTLRGHRAERVNVLFPTNPAPPWRNAPRLRQGQKAVFILRPETALQAPDEFLTAPDPDDVQPRDRLDEIQSLLKR
jgi:hypothetical protein